MDADLDLLLTAVYVTADDLLPQKPENARRSVTDAEVVTLCVAQAIMGIPGGGDLRARVRRESSAWARLRRRRRCEARGRRRRASRGKGSQAPSRPAC